MNVAVKRRFLCFTIVVLIVWIVLWRLKSQAKLTVNREIIKIAPAVISVFYEALCPDSKNFVLKQLTPTVEKLPDWVYLELIPYGKATTTTNPDGTFSFECQHGQRECEANMYHACSIDVVKDNKTMLAIIDCMITDNLNPEAAMTKCVKELADDETLQSINKCFSSQQSKDLLKMYGEKTNALRPRMRFVPTVTIDGSQGTQALILKNLYLEVCKVLSGGGPMPKECEDNM
ncbi:ifi30 family protein [Megaselia abdita]